MEIDIAKAYTMFKTCKTKMNIDTAAGVYGSKIAKAVATKQDRMTPDDIAEMVTQLTEQFSYMLKNQFTYIKDEAMREGRKNGYETAKMEMRGALIGANNKSATNDTLGGTKPPPRSKPRGDMCGGSVDDDDTVGGGKGNRVRPAPKDQRRSSIRRPSVGMDLSGGNTKTVSFADSIRKTVESLRSDQAKTSRVCRNSAVDDEARAEHEKEVAADNYDQEEDSAGGAKIRSKKVADKKTVPKKQKAEKKPSVTKKSINKKLPMNIHLNLDD